jgi:hypothetical protein
VVGLKPPAAWVGGTALKPAFVWSCLQKYPDHDILYLDVDMLVNRSPQEWIDSIPPDKFLCVRFTGLHAPHFCSTLMYWRNCPESKQIAALWVAAQQTALRSFLSGSTPKFDAADDVVLYRVVESQGMLPRVQNIFRAVCNYHGKVDVSKVFSMLNEGCRCKGRLEV